MSSSLAETTQALMDIKDIVDILPHRYPFLLVDKVNELDLENGTITAQKNVTANEQFFQGHFPQNPIMPGVLIIEALAQAGCILFKKKMQIDKVPIFLHLNKVKFRNPVRPGDILLLQAEGVHTSSKGGKIKARAMIAPNKLACEAEMGFALVDLKDI
ncbi:MAG: 3-hydroxyacyl-ACP dehydratase FabZ [Chlamydiales bacterium]|nr:3-hydroxyacyl-ACP dehydratase FabZ [Chlamydiales bacterium]NCF70612.1 3-hydroxyacyl-ACP dehydratase FabZ [Chlamydiales bacterium]